MYDILLMSGLQLEKHSIYFKIMTNKISLENGLYS